MNPTNTQRAEALLHLVLRISAIRTDRDVTIDLMLADLSMREVYAYRDSDWTVRLSAVPNDGHEDVYVSASGSGDSFRAAMDDALADYADKLLNAIKIRADWAEEEGEAL